MIFPESGYIPEVLKLLDDPQWVGKHLHLTLHRPKKETLPIIAKLLGGQPLEKGEEYEFFLLNWTLKGLRAHQLQLPKRGRTLLFLKLVKHFKFLHTNELRQIMAALSKEMDARHVPKDISPKPDGPAPTTRMSLLFCIA